MPDLLLYHFTPSLCSQKVRLALCEKGVPWRGRLVNIGPPMENYEPWYVRKNPRAVVPTLEHDGKIITDSARIVRYIDEHLPGPPLTPAEPERQARMTRWIDAQDRFPFRELSYGKATGLVGWQARGTDNARLRRLRRHRDANPDLAAAYEAKIAEIGPWYAAARDHAAIAAMEGRLGTLLDDMEQALGENEWLAGPDYSLADVVWTVALARAHMLGFGRLFASRPRVAAYFERVRARPSFGKAEVWDRIHIGTMARIAAPVLLPRLAVVAVIVALAVWLW